MKTINIFVDCHVFDGSFQGTTTYLKGLYKELVKNKEIHFFFAGNNVSILRDIFGSDDNIHYLQYSSQNKFYRLLIDIPRLIRKNKIDYAHFQYIVPPIKRCKYIVTVHDILFLDYPEYFPSSYKIKNRFLFKWSAQNSEIVLTVSEYSKERIQKHFGINKITVTPNSVDEQFFETFDKVKIQNEARSRYNIKNYWIYISRWEPRKNHKTLLEVFVDNEYYKKHDLVFIGDKAITEKAFDKLYNSLDIAVKQKIHIYNKVNFQDLLLLLRGATLSVYPSIAEGFGIPPLEALAAGIPSVCSNTTAMKDFDFISGSLFDPKSKTDMNQKIRDALAVEKITDKRSEVKARYDWLVAAERLREILK